MVNKNIYTLQANICKALGHPTRIELIDILQNEELCFSDLLKKIGGPKSNLSQHLSNMTNKGIVMTRKEGLNVYFRLTSKKVSTACRIMREVLIENLHHQNKINKRVFQV